MNPDIVNLPVQHLSYSSMREYCSNRALFKKHYILNLWGDQLSNPAMVAGKGFHKAMEIFLKGASPDAALTAGIAETEKTPDNQVEWGKGGSRESIVKSMTKGFNFYLAEQPNFGELLGVEASLKHEFKLEDGSPAPLPIKAKTDVVSRINGAIHLHDHKLVKSFSDTEDESPSFIIQAMANYHAVTPKFGKPDAIHFHEVKHSTNKDGSAQVRTYTIEYDKHPEYFMYFERLYLGILAEMSSSEVQFLPNFGDRITGKEAWVDFTSELMDFELPRQVSHSASYITNVDRSAPIRSFVESTTATEPEGKIIAKLQEFGMPLKYVEKHEGANVTLYTFEPSRGVAMSKLSSYGDDIALALEAQAVRIQAPIYGTPYVGIEVPNVTQKIVPFNTELLKTGTMEVPVGVDVFGKNHYLDLAKAPHLLVAGATGSGKSVFMNTLLTSLLAQNTTDELEVIIIDPKSTEFIGFGSDPHVTTDIISEVPIVDETLGWLCDRMDLRYKTFRRIGSRDIDEYNQQGGSMPRMLVLIDEYADLALTKEKEELFGEKRAYAPSIEASVTRLVSKARAAGIHLVIATQRPSVNVITGVIKSNIPARIAFRTASQVDSRVILDQVGAEHLMGNGDCLMMNPRNQNIQRLQGFYFN